MAILANSLTRILVQGITGREATTSTYDSLQYGAQIVAGVTPGKGGQNIHGVPIFNSVAQAMLATDANAALISVPARFVKSAAFEAFDNHIPLVVIVTERIPRQDVAAIVERARQTGTHLIGPNSLGVISPHQTRVGMAGGNVAAIHRAYSPGPIGVVSRSGGMMTEIANSLTQNGVGQSTCISIGGDPIIGSTVLDLLPLYEADQDTKALVLYCEPGGTMEEQLAEHLMTMPSRLLIVAFVAGRFMDKMQGRRFGHAGSIVEGTIGSPASKRAALFKAGVVVADKLSEIPYLLKNGLHQMPK